MRLKDKVAIITGGGGGIGGQVCSLFAQEGARLLIAEIDLDATSKISKQLKEEGYSAEIAEVDVRNFDEAQQLAKTAVDIFGQIDILVNKVKKPRVKKLEGYF